MSTQRRAFAKRLAGVTLAAGLVMALTQADKPAPFGAPHVRHHAPIGVHRNDDGSLKLGPRSQIETSNWSGYAVANYATGDTYTSASATWTVPTVSYVAPPEVCHTTRSFFGGTRTVCTSSNPSSEYSSTWVGIGGFCENAACTKVDNTLIQLGTEQDVSSKGVATYYAWIETLPESESEISTSTEYVVHPGDTITASLSCAACTAGKSGSWTLTMTDSPGGWTFSTSVTYTSTLLSAEWIEEAPSSSSGVLPLADYGTATFNTDGANLADADAIEAVNPYGETSNPSSLAGEEFSTCWGNNSSAIATCSPP